MPTDGSIRGRRQPRCDRDAADQLIYGTPGQDNWAFSVTPTVTPTSRCAHAHQHRHADQDARRPTPSLSVLINEVAWAGTWLIQRRVDRIVQSQRRTIDLNGWRLAADDGTPDIALSGSIPAERIPPLAQRQPRDNYGLQETTIVLSDFWLTRSTRTRRVDPTAARVLRLHG